MLIEEQNKNIDAVFQRNSHQPSAIAAMREQKTELLKQILQVVNENDDVQSKGDVLEQMKLGVSLACQIAETRISDEKGDGCEIVCPDVVSPEIRDFCVESYDFLLAEIKKHTTMFIPDILERQPPDDGKRIALLQRYDMHSRRMQRKEQDGNKQLNRLFGSRG